MQELSFHNGAGMLEIESEREELCQVIASNMYTFLCVCLAVLKANAIYSHHNRNICAFCG